jgi:C4-dicarboxylate transporter, DcuC family
MLSLIIGFSVTTLVSYFIVKGYGATGVLLVAGLVLLSVSAAMGIKILPSDVPTTGNPLFDVIDTVRYLLVERSGGLGLMIMLLCGFAAYMNYLGANDVLIKLLSKPLHAIHSPYLLMVVAYLVACAMSLAVSSAAGLGVLLMATLFPLMVNLGISRAAATAICASPAAIILAPTSGDVVMAAEAAGMELLPFAFGLSLPISLSAIAGMGVTHFFWQRWLDRREGVKHEPVDVSRLQIHCPAGYALLPFSPIVGVFVFNGSFGVHLDINATIIFCLILAASCEYLRKRDAKKLFDGLNVVYHGMAEAFSSVVILLVAAGVFAQGLMTLGFIDQLLSLGQENGLGALFIMLSLVVITLLAAVTTGSGNAPFFAFIELIPKLATSLGIPPAYLVIPMLQASNLGRTISPVSGVVVATAGMGHVSPLEVVKRTSVPVAVALVIVMVMTHWLVPG